MDGKIPRRNHGSGMNCEMAFVYSSKLSVELNALSYWIISKF